MKICFSILTSVLLSFLTFAQDSDDNLISRYRPGFMWFDHGIKKAPDERMRKYDRLIFDITYNDWISKTEKPFNVSPFSIGFNTNVLFDVPLTKGNTCSFGWGFYYGLYRVQMNDFFARNDIDQSTTIIEDIKQYGIQRSVFKMNSIGLPFEMRFRGKNWKHAKFHVGAKVSYNFLPSMTLSNKANGIVNKNKTVGFYDFNHFNASAHIRFGIRNWALFASYSFMPLFKDDQSVDLHPLQFGLSVSLY